MTKYSITIMSTPIRIEEISKEVEEIKKLGFTNIEIEPSLMGWKETNKKRIKARKKTNKKKMQIIANKIIIEEVKE